LQSRKSPVKTGSLHCIALRCFGRSLAKWIFRVFLTETRLPKLEQNSTQDFHESGQLAQLAERHPYKVDVAGSTPALPTITKSH
jgi:hypothetical protein